MRKRKIIIPEECLSYMVELAEHAEQNSDLDEHTAKLVGCVLSVRSYMDDEDTTYRTNN